jgi:DNA-binding NtrC family response regulator
MVKEYRILILEDDAADAELIERELGKGEIVFLSKRVETKEAFLKELKDFDPDLILSEYLLTSFDGLSALKIIQEQRLNIPFILVSGIISEAKAIESIRHGSTDYIFKCRLSRLVPSVNRALREAKKHAEYKRIEESLHKRDEELRKRLKELEKFHDMAVGREIRMLELKEEIEELSEELREYKKKSNYETYQFE